MLLAIGLAFIVGGALFGRAIFKRKNRSEVLGILVGILSVVLLNLIGVGLLIVLAFVLPKKQDSFQQMPSSMPNVSPAYFNQPQYPQQNVQMPPVTPQQPYMQQQPPQSAPATSDKSQRLHEAKLLFDEGLINEKEYNDMKSQILSS